MATLKDTAQHFGVSIQAMSDYINKHLQDINTDKKLTINDLH